MFLNHVFNVTFKFKALSLVFFLDFFNIPFMSLTNIFYIKSHLCQNPWLKYFNKLFFISFVSFVTTVARCSDVFIRKRLGWYCWPISYHGEVILVIFLKGCLFSI